MRLLTRTDQEKEEARQLAAYAVKSGRSKGRVHPEPEHLYRTAFQRDRARIIHSSAFRRLEYKTQVFVNHEGDYYRTRLTHSLEASQIARVIARALRLNTDLVEAIALAHDLGHTPFGHAGEDELGEQMQDHGGFNHNLQSLRIVDHLEHGYPQFQGLNLTFEARIGLVKHPELLASSPLASQTKEFKSPLLEAQVVDLSDEIAYDNHDIDDGLASGLLNESELDKISLWRQIKKRCDLADAQGEVRRRRIIGALINFEVSDLLTQTKKNLGKMRLRTPEDAMRLPRFLVGFSPRLAAERESLRRFLMQKLYRHYRVVRMSDKARRFIRALFEVYLSRPEQLPPGSQARLRTEGSHRVICDYIAGMTDRYAQDEYKKFFEPFERV